MANRPNILLILTDQLTLSAMSAVGNPWLNTPNMDRLYRDGASFSKSYCASPVCGPSRMSLATGLAPHEHGYTHHFEGPWNWKDRGLTSFGDQLQGAGYDTRWIGKWHATEYVPKSSDQTQGFTCMPVVNDKRDWLAIEIDGEWATRAADFFASEPTTPFFLGVSLLNPHDICYWISQIADVDKYSPLVAPPGAELPPLPANFAISQDEPSIMAVRRAEKIYGHELQQTKDWTEDDWRRYLYAYYRLVEIVDAEIGRVLDALDESGLADDTLVMLTSDHGESIAGHSLVVKLTLYEESIAVPLVMRWPGKIPAGQRIVDPVSGLDIAPTVLEAGGAQPLPKARGVSLIGIATGESPLPDRTVVCELHPTMERLDLEARIVCGKRYKYILSVGDEIEEALYDLETDPGEVTNVIVDKANEKVVVDSRLRLSKWMADSDDPLLARIDVAAILS